MVQFKCFKCDIEKEEGMKECPKCGGEFEVQIQMRFSTFSRVEITDLTSNKIIETFQTRFMITLADFILYKLEGGTLKIAKFESIFLNEDSLKFIFQINEREVDLNKEVKLHVIKETPDETNKDLRAKKRKMLDILFPLVLEAWREKLTTTKKNAKHAKDKSEKKEIKENVSSIKRELSRLKSLGKDLFIL